VKHNVWYQAEEGMPWQWCGAYNTPAEAEARGEEVKKILSGQCCLIRIQGGTNTDKPADKP